jgi:hypothetical protein
MLQQDARAHQLIRGVRRKFALLRRPRQTRTGGAERGAQGLTLRRRPQLLFGLARRRIARSRDAVAEPSQPHATAARSAPASRHARRRIHRVLT